MPDEIPGQPKPGGRTLGKVDPWPVRIGRSLFIGV